MAVSVVPKAVMMITGSLASIFRMASNASSPLMPGMRTQILRRLH
jgi:hypothetical protein